MCLDRPDREVVVLEACLSAEERARAVRFRFPRDRGRFVVAHGVLRETLACYLGLDPRSLVFEENAHGKPRLAGVGGGADLRFNLAHSDAMALYAVTRGREIGVDVERCDPSRFALPLAERFFSPGEIAALSALPADRQLAGFFALWVRKEAYVKARGDGLSRPLDGFTVSLDDHVVGLTAEDAPGSAWTIHPIDVGPGYVGAVVIEGDPGLLRQWDPAMDSADVVKDDLSARTI